MSSYPKFIKPFLAGFAVWAVGTVTAMAQDKVIPIGVAEFPPFKYSAPDGKIIGSDTEIVEQVFKRMGYTPNIQMQPWKRVQDEAQQGKFAAIYTFTKNPDREKIYYFSDPISTVKDVFYKKKSKKITWQGLDDLKTLRVGASAGYGYHAIFKFAAESKKFAAYEEVFQSPPELANLKKLMADRIDVFICEVSVCQYFVKNNAAELNDIDFIDKPIGDVRTFHAGFPKVYPGAEQLAKDFNAELAKFVKEGKRKPIFKKYNIVTDLK